MTIIDRGHRKSTTNDEIGIFRHRTRKNTNAKQDNRRFKRTSVTEWFQIIETKSQLRELFGKLARPSRSRRKGLQRLADVKPVSELRRGLRRLARLGGLRDE